MADSRPDAVVFEAWVVSAEPNATFKIVTRRGFPAFYSTQQQAAEEAYVQAGICMTPATIKPVRVRVTVEIIDERSE